MKGIAVFTICVILAIGMSLPVKSVNAGTPDQTASQRKQNLDDIHRFADRAITEVRSGQAVALRARQLKAKNKYVAKAMKDMEKRGLKPAFEERGISILAISEEGSFKKMSFRGASPQDIVDGEYEMTFMPYENGNDATWEGIVYFRGGGNDDVDYALFDITEAVETVSEYNYSDDGGSGGDDDEPPIMAMNRQKEASKLIKRASYTMRASTSMQQGGRFQRWAWCSAGGCWGGVLPCRWTGPLWAKCAAANCAGQMISCAIQSLA